MIHGWTIIKPGTACLVRAQEVTARDVRDVSRCLQCLLRIIILKNATLRQSCEDCKTRNVSHKVEFLWAYGRSREWDANCRKSVPGKSPGSVVHTVLLYVCALLVMVFIAWGEMERVSEALIIDSFKKKKKGWSHWSIRENSRENPKHLKIPRTQQHRSKHMEVKAERKPNVFAGDCKHRVN